MKIYHSYWEKGYNKDRDYVKEMHKLSVYKALEHYGNIHLITTKEGKEFLKDLPYTSIELFEEEIPEEYNQVWAISKLFAYKQIAKKREPFLHIDYDFFFFKKIDFSNKELIVQSTEEGHMIDSYGVDIFIKYCKDKGLFYEKDRYIAYNTGIFGGFDYDSIIFYVDEALKLTFNKNNRAYFVDMAKSDLYFVRTIIIEQLYLWYCLEKLNKKPSYFFREWPSEEFSVNLGICHLMGAKFNKGIREKIQKHLLEYENIQTN